MWMRAFKLTSLVDHYGNKSPLLALSHIEANMIKKHTSVLLPYANFETSETCLLGYLRRIY